MSVWKEILLKNISDIKKINFTKLNCKLQKLADEFMSEGMTRDEVFLITEAIKDKTMLNEEIALSMYRKNHEVLLKSEGILEDPALYELSQGRTNDNDYDGRY